MNPHPSVRRDRRHRRWPRASLLAVVVLAAAVPPTEDPARRPPPPWGAHGHRLAAEAAVRELPATLPAFFGEAADQLVYLNPEPDRWRDWDRREMNEAFRYDHYIDLENVEDVPGALEAGNRWEYLRLLRESGLERPEQLGGFLPFRIVELYQRLVTGWRSWHQATDSEVRRWIEARILNDAGLLGHYVTDASQPHHTTIHYNGWAEGAPNPEGYGGGRDFHARFEADYVEAHLDLEDVLPRVRRRAPQKFEDVRSAVMGHIMEAHGEVETLYRLDRDVGFDPGTGRPEATSFAAERLAAGAAMLRDIWWSAWEEGRTGG